MSEAATGNKRPEWMGVIESDLSGWTPRQILEARHQGTLAWLDGLASVIAAWELDNSWCLRFVEHTRTNGTTDRVLADIEQHAMAIEDAQLRCAVLARPTVYRMWRGPGGGLTAEVLGDTPPKDALPWMLMGSAAVDRDNSRPGHVKLRVDPAWCITTADFDEELRGEHNQRILEHATDLVLRDLKRSTIEIDTNDPHRQLVSRLGGRNERQPGRAYVEPSGRKRSKLTANRPQGRIELFVPGGEAQLFLPGEDFNAQLVERIRRALGARGVRHWLAFQGLLSSLGGRMGRVRWTVDDHLAAMGITGRQAKKPEVRLNATETVSAFTRMYLVFYEADGVTERKRYPLIHVLNYTDRQLPDGVWTVNGMELVINPDLYQGVRDAVTGQLGTRHHPLPAELPHLDHKANGSALLIGFQLAFDWRIDNGDTARISGERLLARGGLSYSVRHGDRQWERLGRQLDALVQIGVLEGWRWDGEPGPRTVVELRRAAFLTDRVERGLRPRLEAPDDTPTTGEALRVWMSGKGWTRADLAARCGVSEATVKRWRGVDTLKASVVSKLRAASKLQS